MTEWIENTAEILKNLAQAIAVVGAGIYFLMRWKRGWIYTNLSLRSTVVRTRALGKEGIDNAIVTIRLEKGERANAQLESVVIRAFDIDDPEQALAEKSPNIRHPNGLKNLNLPPGESAQFDVHFLVGNSVSVLFETTVIAQGPAWKTSVISIPLESNESIPA